MAEMSLAERILKNKSSTHAGYLRDSSHLNDINYCETSIPMLNIALSGKFKGGVSKGITLFAGPSKHFKSNLCLIAVKAYLDANPDGICLFFDSEFGTSVEYFNSIGVDSDRVIHFPVTDVEDLKFQMVEQLEHLTQDDNVIIMVDSLGMLASKKEVEDAVDKNSVADMSRAKAIKSLFRIITSKISLLKIPCFIVAHIYKDMQAGPYGKNIVSGGSGPYLAADDVFIIGRRQDKDGKELVGFEFNLVSDKSRSIKEKSTIPISVTFKGGIDKYSGLFDVALKLGYVTSPSKGFYSRVSVHDDKKWRRSQTGCEEFWSPLLEDEEFISEIEDLYSLKSKNLNTMTEDDLAVGDFDEETGEIY